MYARLQRGSGSVYGVDGAIEVSTFRRVSGDDEVLLSLWPTLTEAGADPASEWYEVEDLRHADADTAARVAVLLLFGGPIWEPVRLPNPAGTVRTLALWQPERLCQVTVVLASSLTSIEDSRDRMMARSGADRVDVYEVLSVSAGSPRD